jgi:phage gpG-like protein
MLEFRSDLSGWIEPLGQAAARTGNLAPVHRRIGELMVTFFERNIESEGRALGDRWPELSESTVLHGLGASSPLKRSGRLVQTLAFEATGDHVDAGSPLVYAERVFFGSEPGVTPETPARNPLGLAEADEDAILGVYADHLVGELL